MLVSRCYDHNVKRIIEECKKLGMIRASLKIKLEYLHCVCTNVKWGTTNL
jgi:hypothetical protein